MEVEVDQNVSDVQTCGWRCGDVSEGHEHWSVVVRENGKLLGRLTPSGTANRLKIYAWVMSRETAERVSSEINAAGEYSATVVKF